MGWFLEDLPEPRTPATWAWDDGYGYGYADDAFGGYGGIAVDEGVPLELKYLRGGEVPEGWTRYHRDPLPNTWKRRKGHYPEHGGPISNFEYQTVQQYKRVKHEVYNRKDIPAPLVEAVRRDNEAVLAALRDDKSVSGPWGYRSCLEYGKASKGMFSLSGGQADFDLVCLKWIRAIRAAQERLVLSLQSVRKYDQAMGRKVTQVGLPEIERSMVDQSTRMEERLKTTLDPGACDEGPFSVVGIPTKLGRSICIPPVAQWMIIGLGAYVVFGFLPGMFAAAKVATGFKP